MFERYTEQARRVIFFARYEASASGSAEISTTHLLLGLLREGGEMVKSLLQDGSSIERLRSDLVATQPKSRTHVSTSVDLPLSIHAKRVLQYASEESERLEHRHIDLIHLLLGLFRDPTTSTVLMAHGLSRDKVLTHGTSTRLREASLGARDRVSELVRSFPPELLAQAEEALRAVLTLKGQRPDAEDDDSHTQQRRIRVEDVDTAVETTRNFHGSDVFITEILASGAEVGTMEYSASVRAFGEQRSWRTTFRI